MNPLVSLGLVLLVTGLLLRFFLEYVSDRTVVVYFLRSYGKRLDYYRVLKTYFWLSVTLVTVGLITLLASLILY
jgi:hypothetical protein